MKIKEGYNNKDLEIRIHGRNNQNAEVWLIQKGLPVERYQETLSYASLQELADLKKEIENAILDIVGIKEHY